MAHCLYCKIEMTHGLFCSKEHKLKYRENEARQQAYDIPTIKTIGMRDEDVALQKRFIKSLKAKEKREKLVITRGVI